MRIKSMCLIVLVCATAVNADPLWFVPKDLGQGVTARGVFPADLDGDGDVDILTSAQGTSTVAWLENDGLQPPTFTEHIISSDATSAQEVLAVDLDGDGDLDVISAAGGADAVLWFENDGQQDPSFVKHVAATGLDGVAAIDVGDVDGDGDIDIAATADWTCTFWWIENLGGMPPTFDAIPVSTAVCHPQGVVIGDVDGDLNQDFVVAAHDDQTVSWFENDGAEDPTFTKHVVATLDGPKAVYASDLDSDGDLDVLSALSTGGMILWHENDGQTPPSFQTHTIDADAVSAWSVLAADVDLDGDKDVLAANAGDDDSVTWYENLGGTPPTFREYRIIVRDASNGAFDVQAADIDGDGDTDVLAARASGQRFNWYENTGWPPPEEMCLGDLDGDDDTDVLDFGIFVTNFGVTDVTPFSNGDLDGDQDEDVLDFGLLASDFGCGS